MGKIEILNGGHGHLEVSFDPTNEEDRAKAKATIERLLRDGYYLTVFDDGEDKKVTGFDPEKYVYKVRETPTETKDIPVDDAQVTAFRPVAGG